MADGGPSNIDVLDKVNENRGLGLLPITNSDTHDRDESSPHATIGVQHTALPAARAASSPDDAETATVGCPIPALQIRAPTTDFTPKLKSRTSTASTSSPDESSEDDMDEISEYLRRNRRPATLRDAVDPNDDGDDFTSEVFPMEVDCNLSVTFNGRAYSVQVDGKQHDGRHTFHHFQWYLESSYVEVFDHCKKVVDKIKDQLQDQCDFIDGHEIYLRRGFCRVTGLTDARNYCPEFSTPDEDRLSQVTIQAGCRFISKFGGRLMRLNIYCDYGSILLRPTDEETFADVMRSRYGDKLEITPKTILDQEYISVADLNVLTTQEISDRLIDDDKDENLSLADRQELKREIATRPAQTLLAVCLYAGIPMKCFRHFLLDEQHNYADDRLPPPQATNKCHNHGCKNQHHRALRNNMNKFFALKIADDHWFHERSDSQIVPVSYVNNSRPLLGEGAVSQVFEVALDPAYRVGKSFASNSSQTYALKIFGRGVRNGERHRNAFKKEIRMLLYLAVYPHPFIMTHITSWEQRGTFYILYNKADCNLRTYMEERPGGDLSKKKTLWFLQQLRGLAEAIRKVHQLREPPSSETPEILKRGSKSPKNGQSPDHNLEYVGDDENELNEKRASTKKKKKLGIVGYHHDVKPENILVFEQPNRSPALKLSDFGAGKFSRSREHESSRGPSKARGTLTYFGPEYHSAMKRKMSRPFDIWALGCVYLEFLLWFLGMQKSVVGTGQSLFSIRTTLNHNVRYDFFWQQNTTGSTDTGAESLAVPSNFILNRGVSKVLKKLETQYLKDIPPLLHVTRIIGDMLKIQPKQRLNAVDLANKLDAVTAQAEVDLNSVSSGPRPYQISFDQNMAQSRLPDHHADNPKSTPSNKPSQQYQYPPQMSAPQAPSADVSTIGTSRRSSIPDLRVLESSDSEQNQGNNMVGWPNPGPGPNDFRDFIPDGKPFDSSPARDDIRMSDEENKDISSTPSKNGRMDHHQPQREENVKPWSHVDIETSPTKLQDPQTVEQYYEEGWS